MTLSEIKNRWHWFKVFWHTLFLYWDWKQPPAGIYGPKHKPLWWKGVLLRHSLEMIRWGNVDYLRKC